jgi:hypothetical protein
MRSLNANWQRARVPELEGAAGFASAASPLIPNDRALAAWQSRQGMARPGLVVVATSGGGIRAGLWMGVALTALEKVWPAFPGRVRLITGASGGMLGAAAWTATSPEGGPRPAGDDAKLLAALERGGLKAVSSGLVLRDLWPPPLRFGVDRGRRLEEAWESYTPALAEPFSSLSGGEAAGWRPSLVFSPAMVEDGCFLVASNLDLQGMLESRGPRVSTGPNETYGIRGFQLFSYLPRAWRSLRLSTAVRLQANFPYVLPSTEIPGPGGGHVRVVDAGYRDDLGVELATAWISWNRPWLEKNTSGVLLVQIRNARGDFRTQPPAGTRSFLARGFDGITTPPSGLATSWRNTPPARNDEMLEELAKTMNTDPATPFFTTAILDLRAPSAPLTWSLTRPEADAIRADIRAPHNMTELEAIEGWGRTR